MHRLSLFLSAICAVCLFFISCTHNPSESTESGLNKKNFETEIDGKKTGLYTLSNANNMEVCITNFGGRIVSITVPDKDGKKTNIVSGFDSIQTYINKSTDHGAIIGRYTGNIKDKTLELDSSKYTLTNNNKNSFQNVIFEANQTNSQTLELSYLCKDGEDGFPGNLKVKVIYAIDKNNNLKINYEAETDKTTVINMTQRIYFNLNGDFNSVITNHLLTLNADQFTPIDSSGMSTNHILSVENTPMDFRTPKIIGSEIENNPHFNQLTYSKGYNHNWVLNTNGDINKTAVTLESPITGIVMNINTTQPVLQFYSGANHNNTVVSLETQKHRNSLTQKYWPSVILRPGEIYQSETVYKFSIRK